jgi:hypothetical protein
MAKAYLLLVFCLAARIWAQAPAPSDARYTLRGSVVNSLTGEPIHKASVVLYGPESKALVTGPDGQFEIGGLLAGSYSLGANKAGFADRRVGATPISSVQVGPDTSPVVIKLIPFGKIAGRVVDSDGEPVPNLNVEALSRVLQMGHATWQPGGAATTDEGGNFVLDALQPGQYLVVVHEQQVYPGLAGDDRASRFIYRTDYYPGAPDITSAQPIEIAGGESAQADLTVSEVQGGTIRFAVVPPQPSLQALLRDASGDERNVLAQCDDRSGIWTVAGVSPGSWLLEVQSNMNGRQLFGSAPVEVGDSDARNVVVALSDAGQVPIVFSGDANSQQNGAPPAQVTLISPSVRMFSGSLQVLEAHYSIMGIPPGNYRAQISSNGSQCVDSVTSGASDLARTDYVVPENGAAQPITVNIGADCASVDFSLKQKSNPFFFAVVTGGVYAREPISLFGRDTARATLAPGEYDVYAFADPNQIEYANPDVLKNYASLHISISSNQKTSYKLDLNQPEVK